MTETERQDILEKSKQWFRDNIITPHKENTRKLINPKEFNINPFLVYYLGYFLEGNANPESIAKALILPRALGTSITTTFGTAVQKFTIDVLSSYASTTPGIDIEFTDALDGSHKYCQMKAGPNTINKDDIKTIVDHFKDAKNLARTNGKRITYGDLIVGVIYGKEEQLSNHYNKLITDHDIPVYVGKTFWHHLSGDENFYEELIDTMNSVVSETDFRDELNQIIQNLAESDEIQSMID